MIKGRRILGIAFVTAIAVFYLRVLVSAQTSGGSSGPDTITHPEVTATQCAAATPVAGNQTQLLAQSTVNPAIGKLSSDRLCYIVQNFSTTAGVMVGDQVSATQGVALNPVPVAEPSSVGAVGDTATICVTTALNACGVGGSAVVGVTDITRR